MKKKERQFLSELLKDSKRSDREIAKVLGVSQPTITRMRNRLVEEGLIKEFTIIPEFAKMGYEILGKYLLQVKNKGGVNRKSKKGDNGKPQKAHATPNDVTIL